MFDSGEKGIGRMGWKNKKIKEKLQASKKDSLFTDN